eukprot:1184693-Prorocentrum_minimum.AAC.1
MAPVKNRRENRVLHKSPPGPVTYWGVNDRKNPQTLRPNLSRKRSFLRAAWRFSMSSRVIRWLAKVLMVNYAVSVWSP